MTVLGKDISLCLESKGYLLRAVQFQLKSWIAKRNYLEGHIPNRHISIKCLVNLMIH